MPSRRPYLTKPRRRPSNRNTAAGACSRSSCWPCSRWSTANVEGPLNRAGACLTRGHMLARSMKSWDIMPISSSSTCLIRWLPMGYLLRKNLGWGPPCNGVSGEKKQFGPHNIMHDYRRRHHHMKHVCFVTGVAVPTSHGRNTLLLGGWNGAGLATGRLCLPPLPMSLPVPGQVLQPPEVCLCVCLRV